MSRRGVSCVVRSRGEPGGPGFGFQERPEVTRFLGECLAGEAVAVDFVEERGAPGFSHRVRVLVLLPGSRPVCVAKGWLPKGDNVSASTTEGYMRRYAPRIAAAAAP